jgi:GR25 family glycosyltransferase involved in LPS biosynthesis
MGVKAHIINLAERTDRWESFCEAWRDSGLELVREEAIKMDNVYDAVFLKHREILEKAKERGEEHCLIMEDDAVPRADFAKRFKHLRDYLDIRNDWDVLNGGMLSIRDCIHKIVRIEDEGVTTMCLDVVRGCMAQFVYFKVDRALERIKDWETEGRPEFDGWYAHYLKCRACVPFLAIQKDGHSDASGEHRTWEERFDAEEDGMRYALKDFWAPLAPLTSSPSASSSPTDDAVPPPLVSS